ncbi:hypothetical protein Bca4012_061055 [Brassica carinata]
MQIDDHIITSYQDSVILFCSYHHRLLRVYQSSSAESFTITKHILGVNSVDGSSKDRNFNRIFLR